MFIAYHGTSKKNAKSILKTGFRRWSWFAYNLEDALCYGGQHVFEVILDGNGEISDPREFLDRWQFVYPKTISPKRIVSLTQYSTKSLVNNQNLRDRAFMSFLRLNRPKQYREELQRRKTGK